MSRCLWGRGAGTGGRKEEVIGREKQAARLSVFQAVSFPTIWHSLPLLAAQGRQLRQPISSNSLSFPSKLFPWPPVSSFPLSLSPQSAQLSCWLFTPFQASLLLVFSQKFTSLTNLMFGKIVQKLKWETVIPSKWLKLEKNLLNKYVISPPFH